MSEQYIRVGNSATEDVITIKTSLTALIGKEKASMYVSYCPALALCSQGTTAREAKKNLIEAVQLFIEVCIEDHTLEQVLEDCGFRPAAHPARKKQRTKKIALPPEYADFKPTKIPAEVPMMAYDR